MIPPTSKEPFLNCITLVLLMQVPSGNIKIGSFVGSSTCSFSLNNYFKNKHKKNHYLFYLIVTLLRSFVSDLWNQM